MQRRDFLRTNPAAGEIAAFRETTRTPDNTSGDQVEYGTAVEATVAGAAWRRLLDSSQWTRQSR